MNERRLLLEIKRVVLENVGNKLVSLYVIGSFLSNEMVESSDIDLVGVMKSSFNFRKETHINRVLNEIVRCSQRIDLGMMSYDEFFGGPRKGKLTKHIELPVFLNFLKQAQLVYGKRINFDKLPVKPALPEEELKYHTKVFDKYKTKFRKKNRISPDFSFRDFVKIVFYIANLELHLKRNLAPIRSYSEILKAFRKDKGHVVHYSMRLRRKKTITYQERQSWLDLADTYVERMNDEVKT